MSDQTVNTGAFLVLRDHPDSGNVFRLAPGQVTTIGRSPTSRIVLNDEICSRKHCEVFQSNSAWTLRDLGSRNGTLVDGERISADWELRDGERIRIGGCELDFTHDPSRRSQASTSLDSDTETEIPVLENSPEADSKPSIVHRARQSRYLDADATWDEIRDQTSQELARLYRLGLEMGTASNVNELANVVLAGLFSATSANIGAVLLLPEGTATSAVIDELTVVAYRTEEDLAYEQVSSYLSRMVLEKQEAILARDVAGDARLATRDSLGEIQVASVICAPVRSESNVYGLIHLYSTNPNNRLEPEDMEFTLAVADQMAASLGNVTEKESLAVGLARAHRANRTLRQQLEIDAELVGESRSIEQLRAGIERVAPTDATVLIRGESGVGKELVARAIHFGSNRREGPLVCLNCAALSESLLESELFGHEKGAFTGATEQKPGKFEQAHTGTLFLDEVGEMSLSIQSRFLRVLEGHPFERVGGGTSIQVDVRVAAATNRDLERAIDEGRFRKDLYFRLHVVEVHVDRLSERPTDIPILAEYFLDRFSRQTNRPLEGFTDEALEVLSHYDWPGNVRELQNAIERSVILCAGPLITASDIRLSALGKRVPGEAVVPLEGTFQNATLDEVERRHILSTLEMTGWNKSRAAQILSIERSTLDRRLKRYNISRPSY